MRKNRNGNGEHSFAYCEGQMAAQTRQPCRFTDSALQQQWADGYSAEVSRSRQGVPWWKSNTIRAAMILGGVGVVMILTSHFIPEQTGGNSMLAAGGGMTVGGLLQMFLRAALRTETPVYWGGGYGQTYQTNQP